MSRYVLRRLVLVMPVLLLVTLGIFGLVHLAPGDPLTNVGYVYATTRLPLSRDADIRQNQVNLFYDPRPPVFVVTNSVTGASDFRFYLDLNRNGRFDTNGAQQVIAANGQPTQTTDSYMFETGCRPAIRQRSVKP